MWFVFARHPKYGRILACKADVKFSRHKTGYSNWFDPGQWNSYVDMDMDNRWILHQLLHGIALTISSCNAMDTDLHLAIPSFFRKQKKNETQSQSEPQNSLFSRPTALRSSQGSFANWVSSITPAMRLEASKWVAPPRRSDMRTLAEGSFPFLP